MPNSAESARADSAVRHGTGWWLASAAVLVALTITLYAPVADFNFLNFDDPEYVTGNPHVREGLSLEGVIWAFTASHSANWHPLTWLSHMLDCSMFGLAPGRHHLVNLAFHVANTLLLLLFLHRATGDLWPSTFVAALFAVHPLHVESVAWIAERKDVLSTFFFLLALLSYAAFTRRPSAQRYALLVLSFALGLMAKPMVVTLPLVLLLVDIWPGRVWGKCPGSRVPSSEFFSNPGPGTRDSGPTAWHAVREKLPLFLMAAGASAITFFVQRNSGAVLSLERLPVSFRLGNALVAYQWYLGKTLWPSDLAAFYPMPAQLPLGEILTAGTLFLAITITAAVMARRFPYVLVGWLWFVITLLPVIGLIKAGEQSTADRFTYIPHIGLFIAVAWLGRHVARRGVVYAAAVAAGGMASIALCYAVAQPQLRHWRDGISLFQHALAVTADNYVAHLNLGQMLASQNRYAESIEHFAEAVRLRPDWARARSSHAAALAAVGDGDRALQEYDEALRLDPDDATAHFNRGLLLAQRGALDEAIASYKEALQRRPDYVKAHLTMGIALAAQGKREEAVAEYTEAIRLDPTSAVAHANLGIVLEDLGRHPEAIAHYTEAARLVPNEPRVHYNLGSALEQAGQASAAEQHYREALRVDSDFAPAKEALDNLLAKGRQSGASTP